MTAQGDNPRFLVTNFDKFSARLLYDGAYCQRGKCEQWIGEFKNGVDGNRISCEKFTANAFRMVLHALAYRLLFGLREVIAELGDNTEECQRLAKATFQTLRIRLLKVAFVVRRSVRRMYLQGARSFPLADVFHHLARAMN